MPDTTTPPLGEPEPTTSPDTDLLDYFVMSMPGSRYEEIVEPDEPSLEYFAFPAPGDGPERCGTPHHVHTASSCTQPAGHDGAHAAELIVAGEYRGALAWDATP